MTFKPRDEISQKEKLFRLMKQMNIGLPGPQWKESYEDYYQEKVINVHSILRRLEDKKLISKSDKGEYYYVEQTTGKDTESIGKTQE